MYTREITSENTYTLAEARRIIKAEQTAKREKAKYRIENIMVGVLCLILTALIPDVCDGFIEAWFITIPLTLYFLTRR